LERRKREGQLQLIGIVSGRAASQGQAIGADGMIGRNLWRHGGALMPKISHLAGWKRPAGGL